MNCQHHHPARVAGLRVNSTRLTTRTQTSPMMGETNRDQAPSSAKNPQTMGAVELSECVGRRAGLGLQAVNDVRDDEEDDEVDAAQSPQAFPECASGVDAGG